MSPARRKRTEERPPGTPKFIVAYSAMVTILLAFFIILSSLAEVRELGYEGAGIGPFKSTFNSTGLPGILAGWWRPIQFEVVGAKHVPETSGEEPARGEPYHGRLIDPPEPDLGNALVALLKAGEEVVLPLAVECEETAFGAELTRASQRRLRRVAQILRGVDYDISVVGAANPETAPLSPGATPWETGARYALLVADQLCDVEQVPADRVRALGRIDQSAASVSPTNRAANIVLMLSPKPEIVPRDIRPSTYKSYRDYEIRAVPDGP